MWRIRAVLAILVLVVVLAACGAGSDGAGRERVLKVGYSSHSYQSAGEILAEELGMYAKHGLKVELTRFNGSAQIGAALKSGAIDVGVGDAQASAVSILGGIDLVYFGANINRYTLEMWALPPYESISQLRGRKVGTAQAGALADIGLTETLARHRMSRNDVQIVSFTDPAAKNAALASGAIDAQLAPPPAAGARLEGTAARVIYNMRDIPNLTQAYVTTPEFAEEKGELLTAFLKATRDTDVVLKTEPDNVIPRIGKYMSITNEKHNRLGYEQHRDLYTIDAAIDTELLAGAFARAGEETGRGLPAGRTPASYYDDRFVKILAEEGFTADALARATKQG